MSPLRKAAALLIIWALYVLALMGLSQSIYLLPLVPVAAVIFIFLTLEVIDS